MKAGRRAIGVRRNQLRTFESFALVDLLALSTLLNVPTSASAQSYNGGQILNQNQTYSGTVVVNAADKVTTGAVGVSNPSVTTSLNGDVSIHSYDSNPANTGNTFDHGVAASAGTVNLTGNITVITDSIAGSGVFANGGTVNLSASPAGTPITVSIVRSSGAGTPPSEASAIYALAAGVININGNLVASAAQVRGYGLWNSSTAATGVQVNGNVQITTSGNQGFGIRQESAGATRILGDTVINTQGALAAPGMRVVNGVLSFGGDLTINTQSSPDQVSSSGLTARYESGYGVWDTAASGVVGPGGTITVGGTTRITTTGAAAFGVFNDAPSGVVNFNGPVFINTSGGTGSYSYTPKGALAFQNESIGAYGVETNDGVTNFNGATTITAQGAGSTGGGVRVTGGAANFTRDVTINVSGATGGNGIWLASNSSGRTGVATFGGNTNVTTAGTGKSAARVDKGTLTFNGPSTLSATGSNSAGLTVTNGAAVFNASSIIGGSLNGINVAGGAATFVAPTSISAGSGDAVIVSKGNVSMSAGATIANVPPSAFAIHTLGSGQFVGSGQFDVTGNLLAEGTSALSLNMAGASVVTAAGNYSSPAATLNVSLSDTAIWNMTGSSNVTTLTNNGGLIAFVAPSGETFKTLNVLNEYAGSEGTIRLNTLLNAGGSLANQHTDRLLVSGNASGSTLIEIAPASGSTGAITSPTGVIDASEGISIVQVAGSSSFDTFALRGGYATAPESPYQYRLYAYGPASIHGAADATQSLVGTGGNTWDYRLQTAYVTPDGPVDPEDPGTPSPEKDVDIPANARLAVAPQVASYLTAPAALLGSGFADLDTLHRRLGEVRDDRDLQRDGGPAEMFIRAYGGNYNYVTNQSFKDYGYNATGDYTAIQLGGNVYKHRDDNDGIWRFGLAGTLGWLHFEPEAVDGPSSTRTDTYRVSGYGTYQSQRGWYVDSILSIGWFNGQVSTNARNDAMKLDGNDFAASIEAGYPLAIGAGMNLEPQVQLVGQHVSFKNQTDVDELAVNIGSQNQLLGRLGARLTRPFDIDKGRVTPYAGVDVLHAFTGGTNVQVGDVSFTSGDYGDAIQLSIGANATASERMSLYGRVSYQHSLGDAGSRGWLFNAGARFLF